MTNREKIKDICENLLHILSDDEMQYLLYFIDRELTFRLQTNKNDANIETFAALVNKPGFD